MKKMLMSCLCALPLLVAAQTVSGPDAAKYTELSKKLLSAAKGSTDPATLRFLALQAQTLKDKPLALRVTDEYVSYLLSLGPKLAFTRENLEPIAKLAQLGSDSAAFKFVYQHRYQVDQAMWTGKAIFGGFSYSLNLLDAVIYKEMIPFPSVSAMGGPDAQAKPAQATPDWKQLQIAIDRKFGSSYAERVVAQAKVNWYRDIAKSSDRAMLCDSMSELMRNFGGELSEHLRNNYSWDMFVSCDKPEQLTPAIEWMTVHNWNRQGNGEDGNHNDIDTLANLLYKAGRKEEALACEQEALKQANAILQAKPNKQDSYAQAKIAEYEKTLALMRRGAPTWTNQ